MVDHRMVVTDPENKQPQCASYPNNLSSHANTFIKLIRINSDILVFNFFLT